MSKSVYNIVWADDEIDALLDEDTRDDLENDNYNIGCGFNVIGIAHDGVELGKELENKHSIVDAVIIDANFNKSGTNVNNERIVSGLSYAWNLIDDRYKNIPFFLFSARNEEILREAFKNTPELLDSFPRHKRWFYKDGEWEEMLQQIKATVDGMDSPEYKIRRKFRYELNSSILIDGAEMYLMRILKSEYNNDYNSIVEPFMPIRRGVEKIFDNLAARNLIPPINNDFNGTADYLIYGSYRAKDENGRYCIDTNHHYIYKYKSDSIDALIPKSVAKSLNYLVDIVQDSAHSKEGLKLKVDEYWKETHDKLMLLSCVYIYMDILKWFACTMLTHQDKEINATLWQENK